MRIHAFLFFCGYFLPSWIWLRIQQLRLMRIRNPQGLDWHLYDVQVQAKAGGEDHGTGALPWQEQAGQGKQFVMQNISGACYRSWILYNAESTGFANHNIGTCHRLNMELDLHSWSPCAQLYSLAETPAPLIWAHIRGRYGSAKITTSLCDPLVYTVQDLWLR